MGNQDAQKKATKGSLRRLHQLKDIPDLQTKHGIFEGQVTTKFNKLFRSEYSKQSFESLKLLLWDPNVPLESSSCVNSRKVPDHNVPTTV